MNYAYVRVSTKEQDCASQKLAIKNYCRYHRIHNLIFISENISGTKDPFKRKLGDLINTVQQGDLIIITELSGLSFKNVLVNVHRRIIVFKHGDFFVNFV